MTGYDEETPSTVRPSVLPGAGLLCLTLYSSLAWGPGSDGSTLAKSKMLQACSLVSHRLVWPFVPFWSLQELVMGVTLTRPHLSPCFSDSSPEGQTCFPGTTPGSGPWSPLPCFPGAPASNSTRTPTLHLQTRHPLPSPCPCWVQLLGPLLSTTSVICSGAL